ncbi:hypothetical protein R1sor_010527 [Riccia sorocarpa]|uniref:Reverse transcriptase domain-containing protein n=1 Tax=Riccia sorocarpa TaxID=122646 RepID=A0ABD3HZQ2_9MARC
MDERMTSKTPHVAGSNAIYVELKDNKSVSVMTKEMRQALELEFIPDSIPDDDITPLRRWDNEDKITKDTIGFIQEMQTSDEREDVEVGNERDYFPFSNIEPQEDDPNPVSTTISENIWKKNRRRRTEDEPSNPGKRIRFTIEVEEPQAVEEIAKKLTEKFLQQKAKITMQELFNRAPYCKELMLRRLMVIPESAPEGSIPDDHLSKGNSLPNEQNVPDGSDSESDVGVASIAPWMDIGPEWDLTKNFVELVWRGERRRISTVPRCIPNKASIQPIKVCTLNWEDGLSEEEEMMLQWAMPSLWTIAEIDIKPMEPTSSPDLIEGETSRRQVQFNESTIVPEKKEGEELNYPKILSWKRTVVEIEYATRAARWLQTLPAKDILKEKVHSYTIAPEDTYEEVNVGTIEVPKMVKIGNHLSEEQKKGITKLLRDYSRVFAWTYEDMKGVPPKICQHKIKLLPSAKPLVQRPYRMNPNYAETVKKEIEKLKEADFIYPVKEYDWLSPIVIVPKKNGKLRVCVDYRKLNEFTVKDPYPIPFIDDILDKVAEREAYTFMDGYSGYNQVEIASEDHKKTAFITPWGAYAYAPMPFGLSNAPTTFQILVIDTFAEYIGDFMEAFLDDFTVYGSADQHLQQLENALINCLENQISLNPEKCVFWVQSGVLLVHIICSEGIFMDPRKVEKIRKQPAPTNRKELQRVMDHQALTYIVNKVHITGRIARWLLLLQEFDFTMVYKPGKINILADQLSRIEMGREIEHEDDSFPGEYLLNINLEKPDTHVSSGDETDDSHGGETYEGLLKGGWQTPMRYLLTKGCLPEDTPYHIKKKMAQKSGQYTLIEVELYKQGIDQILRRCVNEEDVPRILEETHEYPSGGHGAGESTT